MRPVILLCCGVFVFGQSASTPNESKAAPPVSSRDQKPQTDDYGLGLGTHGREVGGIEILSDPLGVDFGPYLRQLHKDVKKKWLKGIPAEKVRKGKLAIEFAIRKDGNVAEMKLVATSGDVALDRPAWDAIRASDPFHPLPSQFPHRKVSINLSFLSTSAPGGELPLSVTQLISTPPQLPPPEHAIASAAPAASCKSRLPQNPRSRELG
jgi:TonB family protein